MPGQEADRDTLFGKLAVERGYLTEAQLDEAREAHAAVRAMGVDQPLVQILLGKHFLTPDQAQELANAVAVRTGEARLVAGYEVVAKLGQGGMGAVYKARKLDTGDLIALKVLPPSLADENTIARFRRESEIVKKLSHENIMGFVEFGRDERRKCWFCALELIEGEDLRGRIERLGALSEDEAISITYQVAQALGHAYFNGLVHRDVKPENIMVTPDGTAKLLDLGLARPADLEATRMTQSGVFVGSPYYVSPEQAMGERSVDIRADIYSLGATLYHCVTGKPPFGGTTVLQVLRKHITEKLPWPADVNPALSDGLCLVITKMMAKDAADRYQEPKELLYDLDALVEGSGPKIDDAVLRNSSVAVALRRRPARPRRPSERRLPRARERIERRRRRGEERPAPAPEGMSPGAKQAIVIGGAVVAAVLVGALLLAGGRSERGRRERGHAAGVDRPVAGPGGTGGDKGPASPGRTVSPEARDTPTVSPARRRVPTSAVRSAPRQTAADALREAEEYEAANPDKKLYVMARYEAVARKFPGTPEAAKAEEKLAELRRGLPQRPASASAGVPADAVEFGGNFYKLFPQKMTWHEAKRFCEEKGGHLVTITSKEENDFVTALARAAGTNVWIGFTDEREEGEWEWVTGEAAAFTMWSQREPSHTRGEYCACLAFGAQYRWADYSGDVLCAVLCEWEPGEPAQPVLAHHWRLDDGSDGFGFGTGKEFPGAAGRCTIDAHRPKAGTGCLRIHGDFSGGGGYVATHRVLPAPVDLQELRFWARTSDARGLSIRLVDSSRQTHQQALDLPPDGEWHQLRVTVFDRGKGYDSWGGAEDGKWHPPATRIEFLLGKPMLLGRRQGVLWLDEVEILRGAPRAREAGARRIDLTRGLVGWWKFDEAAGTAARDSSGNGHHGTIRGSPARLADGRTRGAFRFNGVSDWVEVPHSEALNVRGDLTLSLWMRARAPAGGNRSILGKRIDAGGGTPYGLTTDGDGRLAPCFRFAGRWHSTAFRALPRPGLWEHAAVTRSGGTMRLYRNGRLDAEKPCSQEADGTSKPLLIAGPMPDIFAAYAGDLDDLRIYDRALSAAEVALLASGDTLRADTGKVTPLVPPPGAGRSTRDTRKVSPTPDPAALSRLLDGFDALVRKGDFAGARKHAEEAVRGTRTDSRTAESEHVPLLRAAARVAKALEERAKAIRGAAEALVGKEAELATSKGRLRGKVVRVTDSAIFLAVSRKAPGGGAIEMHANVKWSDLTPGQEEEFARAGGWKAEGADAALAMAILAFERGDEAAVGRWLGKAGDSPLAGHVQARVAKAKVEAAYAAAMDRARARMKLRNWKGAVESLEEALAAKPEDAEAKRLLAEAESHIGPAPTLTLDLGPRPDGQPGKVTMEVVYIKPGVFTMGGAEDPKHGWQGVEKPKHEVAITRGFYIGRYEVTRGQFAAFVKATGHRTEAEKEGKSWGRRTDGSWGEIAGASWRDPVVFAQTNDHPVMCVSWNDVKVFCEWAAAKTRRDVRLPTEAEWEYAARAGSTTRYCFGDSEGGLGEYAWHDKNSNWQTHPVGQKKANAWGLYDTHGNVWEWVADWYAADYYAKSPRENPTGPDGGGERLLRCGSWSDNSYKCRSAIRNPKRPSYRFTSQGFRACVSSSPRGK